MAQNGLHLVDRSAHIDQALGMPVAEGAGGEEPVPGGILPGAQRQIHHQLVD